MCGICGIASLDGIDARQADVLYTYGFASLAFLRAHSSDWNSLAELPQMEALFNHYMAISGDAANSAVFTYMGILLTLRPPALGGEQHFRPGPLPEGDNLEHRGAVAGDNQRLTSPLHLPEVLQHPRLQRTL